METNKSNTNGNSLNIEYIKIAIAEIVEEYFSNNTKSLFNIISEVRNKYDCD